MRRRRLQNSSSLNWRYNCQRSHSHAVSFALLLPRSRLSRIINRHHRHRLSILIVLAMGKIFKVHA